MSSEAASRISPTCCFLVVLAPPNPRFSVIFVNVLPFSNEVGDLYLCWHFNLMGSSSYETFAREGDNAMSSRRRIAMIFELSIFTYLFSHNFFTYILFTV